MPIAFSCAQCQKMIRARRHLGPAGSLPQLPGRRYGAGRGDCDGAGPCSRHAGARAAGTGERVGRRGEPSGARRG